MSLPLDRGGPVPPHRAFQPQKLETAIALVGVAASCLVGLWALLIVLQTLALLLGLHQGGDW